MDTPAPPLVPILTDAELSALLNACTGRGFRQRRDEAIIRLLLDCGLRAFELVGIDVKELDLDAEAMTVTGTGGRVRMAYYSAKTGRALDRYLRERRGHRYAGDPGLLFSERGGLTTDGVRTGSRCEPSRPGWTRPRSTRTRLGTAGPMTGW